MKVQKGERDLANRSSRSRVGGHPVGRGGGSVHLSTVRTQECREPAACSTCPGRSGGGYGTRTLRRSHFSVLSRATPPRQPGQARKSKCGVTKAAYDARRTADAGPGGERPTATLGSEARPSTRRASTPSSRPVERLRSGFIPRLLFFNALPIFAGRARASTTRQCLFVAALCQRLPSHGIITSEVPRTITCRPHAWAPEEHRMDPHLDAAAARRETA